MQIKNLKTLFLTRKPPSNKVSDWIKTANFLPQDPVYLMQLMKMVNRAKLNRQLLSRELVKNKELLAKLLNINVDLYGFENLDSADIENSLGNIESTFLQNNLELIIVRKYNAALSVLTVPSLISAWKDSVKTALIAKTIAQWCDYDDSEIAFFAGLLHRIPSILMSHNDMTAKIKIDELVAKGSQETEAELIVHGFDHCEFGVKLFKYLGLPEDLVSLVQSDLVVDKIKSKYKTLAQIVNFARFVSLAFSDKTQSPSSIWSKAQKHLVELDLKISAEEWANKISILFVRSLEFEMSATHL